MSPVWKSSDLHRHCRPVRPPPWDALSVRDRSEVLSRTESSTRQAHSAHGPGKPHPLRENSAGPGICPVNHKCCVRGWAPEGPSSQTRLCPVPAGPGHSGVHLSLRGTATHGRRSNQPKGRFPAILLDGALPAAEAAGSGGVFPLQAPTEGGNCGETVPGLRRLGLRVDGKPLMAQEGIGRVACND